MLIIKRGLNLNQMRQSINSKSKEKFIVEIYTDGACKGNPGPGGWGAVIFFPNKIQEISGFHKETTNNRMELLSIIEAVKLVKKCGFRLIKVYSDSAYVVNAINKGWVNKWILNGWITSSLKPVANQELWKKYLYLTKNITIKLYKVKGHSTNEWNNRADRLAVEAIEKEIRK